MLVKDDIICPKCGGMTPDYLRYNRRRLGVSVHWACCCGAGTCTDCGLCSFSNTSTVTVTWAINGASGVLCCPCSDASWLSNTLTLSFAGPTAGGIRWGAVGIPLSSGCDVDYTATCFVVHNCALNTWTVLLGALKTFSPCSVVNLINGIIVPGDCASGSVVGAASNVTSDCQDGGPSTVDIDITLNDNGTCALAYYRLQTCPDGVDTNYLVRTTDVPSQLTTPRTVVAYDSGCYIICDAANAEFDGSEVVLESGDYTTGGTCCDGYQAWECAAAGANVVWIPDDLIGANTRIWYDGNCYKTQSSKSVWNCSLTVLGAGDFTLDPACMDVTIQLTFSGIAASSFCCEWAPVGGYRKCDALNMAGLVQVALPECAVGINVPSFGNFTLDYYSDTVPPDAPCTNLSNSIVYTGRVRAALQTWTHRITHIHIENMNISIGGYVFEWDGSADYSTPQTLANQHAGSCFYHGENGQCVVEIV